jgi:hypothetical protein
MKIVYMVTLSQPSLNEQRIDAMLEDSFPASDPPSWTLGTEMGTKHAKED